MEKRIPPNKNHVQLEKWSELYVLSRYWKSDMEFYRDEIRFLRGLIDRYFIWLVRDENIGLVHGITGKLLKSEEQLNNIYDNIEKHLDHLQELIDGVSYTNTEQFIKEHTSLEEHTAVFMKSFREIKRQVFAVTEHVIGEEKLKRLLMS